MRIWTAGAILLTLTTTTARAEDYPTDSDLQVAYCDGAADYTLKTMPPNIPASARDVILARRQHFRAYLASRGYFDRKDLLTLVPAMDEGSEDAQLLFAAAKQCHTVCRPIEPPGESQQSQMALEQQAACVSKCLSERTGGKAERLRGCTDVENSLPF